MKGTQEVSEVARLLSQIQAEYEAARRGMSGLSCGSSQHATISQKTNRIYLLQEELQDIVGTCAAIMLVDLKLQDCTHGS